MASLLAGSTLLKNDDGDITEVKADEALAGKVVAFYFSAMWCGSCRTFTPKLTRFYKALKEAGKNLEIVLVSRDREEDDLKEYLGEHNGNWLAIPFGDENIQEFLQKFEIKTIPALIVLKPDGTVVVDNARTEVQERGKDEPLELFAEWEKAAA